MGDCIKYGVVLMFVLNLISCSIEKDATVVFRSDKNMDIEVCDPIDGTPNYFYVTKKIRLQANMPVTHKVNVDNFACMTFKSEPILNRYNLLLLEGDSVKVDFSDNKINISGDNAEGNKYLYNNFITKGLGFHHYDLVPWVEKAYDKNINFCKFGEQIKKWREQRQYKKDLLELLNEGKIDKKFYSTLSKTLEISDQVIIANVCMWMIQGQIKQYIPAKEEKDHLFDYIDQLYSAPIMLNKDAPKNLFYSSTNYYTTKYKRLDEEEKLELEKEYDPSVFGGYIGLLLAPDYIQFATLGDNAIYIFQSGIDVFDNTKLVQWFQSKFPHKEYTMILNKLLNEQKEKAEKKIDIKFIDTEAIRTFKDFVTIEGLKGKKLYIDLWASWCSPCIAQFKYRKQVRNYIQTVCKNVVPVYISIDENDSIWKKQINFHELDGYHLRASKSFINYLGEKFYKNQSISVPRYLLIDENGNILDDDLPRPSLIEKLKESLDNAL